MCEVRRRSARWTVDLGEDCRGLENLEPCRSAAFTAEGAEVRIQAPLRCHSSHVVVTGVMVADYRFGGATASATENLYVALRSR